MFEIIEKWYVCFSNKICSLNFLKNLMFFNVALFHGVLDSGFSNDINLVIGFILHLKINEFRVDSSSKVGWQSPRSGCPSNETGIWLINEWESDEDGWIFGIFVV